VGVGSSCITPQYETEDFPSARMGCRRNDGEVSSSGELSHLAEGRRATVTLAWESTNAGGRTIPLRVLLTRAGMVEVTLGSHERRRAMLSRPFSGAHGCMRAQAPSDHRNVASSKSRFHRGVGRRGSLRHTCSTSPSVIRPIVRAPIVNVPEGCVDYLGNPDRCRREYAMSSLWHA